jgi:bifunctional DNA-binding transcriptional regulator/antitoxin component of YhaV-PrlF toxin-antitoxin module
METTVTRKNMVTIPAELGRRFAITAGCKLAWDPVKGSTEEIRVRVIPRRGDRARKLRGAGKLNSPQRDGVAELVAEREIEG